jgi:hypothetical protein
MLIVHFYRSSESNTRRKPHLLGCFSGSHYPNELAIFGILASWSAYRSVTIISILGQALHLYTWMMSEMQRMLLVAWTTQNLGGSAVGSVLSGQRFVLLFSCLNANLPLS